MMGGTGLPLARGPAASSTRRAACPRASCKAWRQGMKNGRSMCPAIYCRGENPVQALVNQKHADKVGEPKLAGAVHCTSCGAVYSNENGKARILGRFRGPMSGIGWTPARD